MPSAATCQPDRVRPPSAAHWFGTDELGRDILTRLLHGGRLSWFIGITPVVLAFGLWEGPRRYRVRFEPFADPAEACRSARGAAAAERAARYAARLEAVCRAHPYNWFNFHDFWEETR